MNEFTVIFNVQVTKILKGGDEEKIAKLNDAKKKQMESIIKAALDADDVDVSDYKVFMKEE